MPTRWIYPTPKRSEGLKLSKELNLPVAIGNLLSGRGWTDPEATEQFLDPKLRNLRDPFEITNLKAAVRRIRTALEGKESVLIFGDYDVDGVTSTTLLVSILRKFGITPNFIVPNRMDEGYGLSTEAIERAVADHGVPQLLIAVDCGTSAKTQIKALRDRGIDVVIIDHHTSKEALPEDCILVNPKVHDSEEEPWWDLCTVGLVFKVVHGLLKSLRETGDVLAHELDLRTFLDLVALGTVSDLVSLQGENRILTQAGLLSIHRRSRPGIHALLEVSGLRGDSPITPFDIGFRMGPRINASGRLADASLPIELLLTEDWSSAHNQAKTLDDMNRERQDIERQMAEEAIALVEDHYAEDFCIVLHRPDWHAGVVGIVASRISRQFHRPAIILGSENEPFSKGSGRSIEGINLVDCLRETTDLIEQWGGHPMAIGLTIETQRIGDLRTALNAEVARTCDGELPERTVKIDLPLEYADLLGSFLDSMKALEPFGQKNPEPIFALEKIRIYQVNALKENHQRFSFKGPEGSISGVYWGGQKKPIPTNTEIDIAFRFSWNTWNGRREPRMSLIDWRPADLN